MQDNIPTNELGFSIGRRRFLVAASGGIAAAALAACSKDDKTSTTNAPDTTESSATTEGSNTATTLAGMTGGGGGDGTIKIGYVSPQTGALAAFGAADGYVIDDIKNFVADGLRIGDKSYTIEVLLEDSESNPDTAAAKAAKLIDEDAVDLVLVSSTPETTNPVSDTCEASGVPCISTVAPWQPWLMGRGGAPGADPSFEWTYHFFWGLEDVISTFVAMWDQVDTNKTVGGLFPNDGDGNAWGDAENGFPKPLSEAGYTLVDPGRYENLNQDFTAQINAFKDGGCEVITGVMIPPDFPTFWKQAKQQGFVPKVASIGKALLFPESIEALGEDGAGLSSEVWWSPSHPYSSSLVGLTAKEFTDAYTENTTSQWTQPLGFAHALFEVAFAALASAGSSDKTAVRDAISTLSLDTIVGNVTWGDGPSPNVAKTKLVGGQWRSADSPTGFDLVIVDNSGNPDVPTGGSVEPIAG